VGLVGEGRVGDNKLVRGHGQGLVEEGSRVKDHGPGLFRRSFKNFKGKSVFRNTKVKNDVIGVGTVISLYL